MAGQLGQAANAAQAQQPAQPQPGGWQNLLSGGQGGLMESPLFLLGANMLANNQPGVSFGQALGGSLLGTHGMLRKAAADKANRAEHDQLMELRKQGFEEEKHAHALQNDRENRRIDLLKNSQETSERYRDRLLEEKRIEADRMNTIREQQLKEQQAARQGTEAYRSQLVDTQQANNAANQAYRERAADLQERQLQADIDAKQNAQAIQEGQLMNDTARANAYSDYYKAKGMLGGQQAAAGGLLSGQGGAPMGMDPETLIGGARQELDNKKGGWFGTDWFGKSAMTPARAKELRDQIAAQIPNMIGEQRTNAESILKELDAISPGTDEVLAEIRRRQMSGQVGR